MVDWNTETVATLERHVGDGLSLRKSAQAMGLSENAVIAYANRNGIKSQHPTWILLRGTSRRDPTKLRPPTAPRRLAFHGPRLPPPPPKPPLAAPTCEPVGLLAATDEQCRHIVRGSGAGMMFCGEQREGDLSYCTFHSYDYLQRRRRA